jgi:Na+/proline symporter
MGLATIDIILVAVYAIVIFGLAQFVSREKAGHEKDSSDYFLASKSLPWWAIGASLIAANISAEQIIGMSGSGYAIGLGIASCEWVAALTVLIGGKFFLPIFLRKPHRVYRADCRGGRHHSIAYQSDCDDLHARSLCQVFRTRQPCGGRGG